jgi:hypothetical protein
VVEHTKKLSEEAASISRIFSELESNPNYLALSPRDKANYQGMGKWHNLSKSELLAKSGFAPDFAATIYSHLSSFSHAGSLSQLQTAQASYAIAEKIVSSTIRVVFIAAGFYLRNYLILFPKLSEGVGEKDREFYLSWCELGETIAEIY